MQLLLWYSLHGKNIWSFSNTNLLRSKLLRVSSVMAFGLPGVSWASSFALSWLLSPAHASWRTSLPRLLWEPAWVLYALVTHQGIKPKIRGLRLAYLRVFQSLFLIPGIPLLAWRKEEGKRPVALGFRICHQLFSFGSVAKIYSIDHI